MRVALIFAVPFIILTYLIYSIFQKESARYPKVTVIKSKTLPLRAKKPAHAFGWRDLRKEMLWESIIEGIILIGIIALMVIYFFFFGFGKSPKTKKTKYFTIKAISPI